MKIVMLCDFFNEQLEYQENHLVEYYERAGHSVTVICSLYDDVFDYYNDVPVSGPPKDYRIGRARIVKLPYRFNILHKLRAYTKIDMILEGEKPDLIYVHDIMLNFPECIEYVKKNPKCKMIMDYHADYSNSGRNWISLKILHGVCRNYYLRRARPYLEKIFPVVPVSFEFLHEVYGVPMEEMELLPLGTSLDYGHGVHASGAGASLRRELGIADDSLVIFTGGKLDPLKKTDRLIRAFNRIEGLNADLLVIGSSGKEYEDYGDLLRSLAAGNRRIHFTGWQDKAGVYAHLDAADLAVFPASQSVLWQQAIGMGLPLVVGDRSELVRGHQDASYLNRHGNLVILNPDRSTEDQLFELLQEFVNDRPRLARMSDGARKTAAEILDWSKLIEKTLRYNEIDA